MRTTEIQRGLLTEMSHRSTVRVPWPGYSRRTFQALAAKGLIDLREDSASVTRKGHDYLASVDG